MTIYFSRHRFFTPKNGKKCRHKQLSLLTSDIESPFALPSPSYCYLSSLKRKAQPKAEGELKITWKLCYWEVNFSDSCIVLGNVQCVLYFGKGAFLGLLNLNSECRQLFCGWIYVDLIYIFSWLTHSLWGWEFWVL